MEAARAGNSEVSGFCSKGSGSNRRVLPFLIDSSGCFVGLDYGGKRRRKGQ